MFLEHKDLIYLVDILNEDVESSHVSKAAI